MSRPQVIDDQDHERIHDKVAAVSRPQVIDDEQHEQVHERVAAIDVAKDSGMVCTRTPHPSRPGARRPSARPRRQPG